MACPTELEVSPDELLERCEVLCKLLWDTAGRHIDKVCKSDHPEDVTIAMMWEISLTSIFLMRMENEPSPNNIRRIIERLEALLPPDEDSSPTTKH